MIYASDCPAVSTKPKLEQLVDSLTEAGRSLYEANQRMSAGLSRLGIHDIPDEKKPPSKLSGGQESTIARLQELIEGVAAQARDAHINADRLSQAV